MSYNTPAWTQGTISDELRDSGLLDKLKTAVASCNCKISAYKAQETPANATVTDMLAEYNAAVLAEHQG